MGREEALVFLNELPPAAPYVTVQIAHMGGAGGIEPTIFDEVLGVFVEAIAKADPRTKNLWFDVRFAPKRLSTSESPGITRQDSRPR
jgi:hypothetical protein